MCRDVNQVSEERMMCRDVSQVSEKKMERLFLKALVLSI